MSPSASVDSAEWPRIGGQFAVSTGPLAVAGLLAKMGEAEAPHPES